MMLCRWTQDSIDMQTKPKFYEECPPELLGRWDDKEQCQYFINGSKLYIRALKTSDDKSRYIKFSGLTLGIVAIDQAEEVPADVFSALKGRISQPGFPQQVIITPNPPAPNHWICTEFPEDNHIDNHRYMCISMYDNRKILGEEYIADKETEYPAGHVLRRRFIEGKRGLAIEGQPVYGRIFSRGLHVQDDIRYIQDFPLYESWDFGQKHPAVSWHQLLPGGWWNILACFQGENQYLDEVVPQVAGIRAQMFPNLMSVQVCCDPAGAQGQGVRQTSVTILNDHLRQTFGTAIGAIYRTDANRPERRDWAIQQISGYMTRLIAGRTAMAIHPRCEILIDGFEAGYVFDDRAVLLNSRLPNLRRPRKDGWYDHLQNTAEYFMLSFGASDVPGQDLGGLNARQRLRAMQRDEDSEGPYGGGYSSRSRAGGF